MTGSSTMITEMLLFCLGFWELAFLALGFLTSFLSSLGGTPKIDLPLSTFLISLFLVSTLLAGGTKIAVLVEAILGEEKSYLKPVQSKADF